MAVALTLDAAPLLVELKERGITLTVRNGRLIAEPGRLLAAEDRQRIAEAKDTLVLLVLGRYLADAHHAVQGAWRSKRAQFGDTPPDDPRPAARAASDACLEAHATYMAALVELHAAGGSE